MRSARFKAPLPIQRSHRQAKLCRAAIDALERRVLFAGNIIQVDVALDEDGLGNPFANSLRAAIIAANATPGSTIEFTNITFTANPAAGDPQVPDIVLNDDLSNVPITAAGTIIDGTTAPNNEHRIVISGAGRFNGLDIQAPGVIIQGLSFINLGEPPSPAIPGAAITLDTGSSNDVIQNDDFGMSGVANGGSGSNDIDIDITNGSTGDTIGGTNASERNIIGAATGDPGNTKRSPLGIGVDIEDPTAADVPGDNIVEGNYIGISDQTGNGTLANTVGVELQDVTGNTIQKNVIGSNTTEGILTTDPMGTDAQYGNLITNNLIGVDSTGLISLANGGAGVQLEGGSATAGMGGVGEGDTVSDNTIEDNTGNGVNVQLTLVSTTPMVVYSGGMYNQITSNTIESNGDSGIVINRGAEANTISQNSITLNGIVKGGIHQIGIDLSDLKGTNNVNSFNEDGFTPDTITSGTGVGASATGGNELTPFPVLGTIIVDPSNSSMYQVPIQLQGEPPNPSTTPPAGIQYTVELFSNLPTDLGYLNALPNGDGLNYGEGGTYLGSATVITTTANQFATGTFDFPKSLNLSGDYISSTATDVSPLDPEFNPAAGATSEFSADVVVPGLAEPTVTIGNASATVGNNIMFPITLSNSSNSTISIPFTINPGTTPTTDYAAPPSPFMIPPGTTTTTLNVNAAADKSGKPETFQIVLGTPTNATLANLQSTESATGTILPNAGTTATVTTLSETPNPIKQGANVTFTARVTLATGTGTAPTGTVNFVLNGTIIGTATLNNTAIATLIINTLPVGPDPITAVYEGDTTYAGSTSNTVTVQVDTDIVSTLTLSASSLSIAQGGNVSFTATVTPNGATPLPSGIVTFFDNGVELGTGAVFNTGAIGNPLSGNGDAFFDTTTLSGGTNVITASYAGDNLYTPSTSNSVTVTVNVPPFIATTITVTPSATNVAGGTSVTFVADVVPAVLGSGDTETGAVSFFDNSVLIGSETLQSDGTATLITSTLPAGSDSITADYTGDANFGPSVSDAVVVNVSANTTTSLTASSNLIYVGQSITLTATVDFSLTDGVSPTGTVTFIEGGVDLAEPVTINPDGTAQLVIMPETVEVGTITAVYSGDTNYTPSTSPAITQTVVATPTSTTAVTASAKLLGAVGDPVTLVATVSPIPAGGATPTGTVTFADEGTVLGVVTLTDSGVASLTSTGLVQGINTITATYNGSATYTSSLPATVSVNVNGPGLLPIKTVTGLTSGIAGVKIHQLSTITLMNPNSSATTGVGTLNLYASNNGTVDANSILLRSLVLNQLNVGAGKTVAVKDLLSSLPSNLPSGGYTLLALMMSPSGIDDFASTGPSFTVSAPFIQLTESVSTVNLGTNIVGGAATKGSVKLLITNHGNVPSTGPTTFNITASPVSGIVGTTILSVTENVTIPAGKSKSILIKLGNIPSFASGKYYLVAQVTDPDNGVSVATASTPVTIAPAFVSLSAAFAAGSSTVLKSGATIVITNNGNVDDITNFSALMGFSTDPAGTQIVPQVSATIYTPTLRVKAGKSVTIHLNGWKGLVLGLTKGVQYYATVTVTDAATNSAFAVNTADVITV